MPSAGHPLRQRQQDVYIFAALNDCFRTGQRLHALVGRNPFAASDIAIATVGFEREPKALGLLRREYQLVPPRWRKHLESPFAIAVNLIIIDDAPDAFILESLQIGRYTLMRANGLTVEPPHLGAGRVLRMVETEGQRGLCR